jgi:hypothetical protein
VTGTGRKLLIAAEGLGGADTALSFCRAIVDWSPATLSGLIVEPASLAIWAGAAPKIVSTRGTLLAAPTDERLRRMAKGDAAELGARLALLAQTLNTQWDCTLAAGDIVSAACAMLTGEDILLLGQRPIFRGRSRVLLLGGQGGASEASRALAETIARASRTSVSVLLPEDRADEEAIVALVERKHAAAVVFDLDAGPISGEEGLRRLYMAARCPIVALGAARIRSGGDNAGR